MGFKVMENYNGESAELVKKHVPKGHDFDEIYLQLEVDGIKYLTLHPHYLDHNEKDYSPKTRVQSDHNFFHFLCGENAVFDDYTHNLKDGFTFRLIKDIKPYKDGGRGIDEYSADAILVTEVKNIKTLEKIASEYNRIMDKRHEMEE